MSYESYQPHAGAPAKRRCLTCWMDGPHAGMDNGFVHVSKPFVHARSCDEWKPVLIVEAKGDAPQTLLDKLALALAMHGSIFVLVQDHPNGPRVYYEGGRLARDEATPPTEAQRDAYAKQAAGRAAAGYPTVAFFEVTKEEMMGLLPVGEVNVSKRPYEVKWAKDGSIGHWTDMR